MKKNTRYEYQVLEFDVEDESLEKKINNIALTGFRLISVTPTLSRIEDGIGKTKGYDRILAAQYIFEKPIE